MTALAPEVFHVGTARTPVMVIDAVSGRIEAVRDVAAGLAPFPPARGNSYPGVRRHIKDSDTAAAAYARQLLGATVGAINRTFGFDGFALLDASFSVVTATPERLTTQQSAPHFDSTDPDYLAVMHFVAGVDGSGTAFYRQRATGIEVVSDANLAAFVGAAQREAAGWRGYIGDTNPSFERIGAVEALPDRVVVYPSGLLHSGTIPAGMTFDPDPRRGRLTANFFVRGRRA
ncbi:DUF6445 family protein [Glacieibacterium sp.]|uniref:DUF6445 family protein n=1 Tax=Glacieibacterium sp. TaxID=2860237 RepID=UPI003B00230B